MLMLLRLREPRPGHVISACGEQSRLATIGAPGERAILAGRFSFASGLGGLIAPLVSVLGFALWLDRSAPRSVQTGELSVD